MSNGTSKAAQSATWRKECKRCKKKKTAASFTMNAQYADGLQPVCMPCASEMSKERDRRRKEFLKGRGEGELVALTPWSKMMGISTETAKLRCENGEVDAVNLGTLNNNAWRVWVPTPNLGLTNESIEEGAEATKMLDAQNGLDVPVEQLAQLGGRMARLEGMADMLGSLVDGTENFVKELDSFFAEVRRIIVTE